MKPRRVISVCTMAFLLIAWGLTLAEEPQRGGQPPTGTRESLRAQEEADTDVVPLHSPVVESLGSGSNAVDAWAFDCPDGTTHAHFDIRDLSASGPTLGILAVSNTFSGRIRRASQGGTSSQGLLNGTNFVFYIFKTGGSTGSSTSYDSVQVCHDANHNFLSEVGHVLFQNQ